MKLYDKKFLIYGNCPIRSFGQPGYPRGKAIVEKIPECKENQQFLYKRYID